MKISFLFLFCIIILILSFTHANNDLAHNHHHNDELTTIYQNYNDELGFDHWMEYGGHYDTNIRHLKHRSHISLLEIGVQSGGSTIVWKRYFTTGMGLEGRTYNYVGLDINPNCKQFERLNENVHIVTGSQTNVTLLHSLCEVS